MEGTVLGRGHRPPPADESASGTPNAGYRSAARGQRGPPSRPVADVPGGRRPELAAGLGGLVVIGLVHRRDCLHHVRVTDGVPDEFAHALRHFELLRPVITTDLPSDVFARLNAAYDVLGEPETWSDETQR